MAGQRDGRRKPAEIARRRARVLELKDEGLTFQQIADALGISVGLAHKDFTKAVAEIPVKSVEQYREHQAQILATMREVAWDVVQRRHKLVSDGRLVCGEDGEPELDDGPVLQALDRLMKIEERQAKLFGLDARPELQVTGNLTYEILGMPDATGANDEAG